MKEINGCIETVLVQHFKLQLWHNHVKRLRKSLMCIDKSRLDAPELEKKVLIYMNSIAEKDYVLRIEYNKLDRSFDISHRPVPSQIRIPQVSIIRSVTIPVHPFSWMKSTHRSVYDAAMQQVIDRNLDDAILLNESGRICESTIANIFLKKKSIYITPSLDEGCVEGVYRKKFITDCKRKGIEVEERPVYPDEVPEADAVYFSNAIRRLYPVQLSTR